MPIISDALKTATQEKGINEEAKKQMKLEKFYMGKNLYELLIMELLRSKDWRFLSF